MVSSATPLLHGHHHKRLKISNCENPELDSHASIGSSLLPITEDCSLHGYYFTLCLICLYIFSILASDVNTITIISHGFIICIIYLLVLVLKYFFRCFKSGLVSSSCCGDERFGSNSEMEMSCQSNGISSDIQQSSNSGGISFQDKGFSRYETSAPAHAPAPASAIVSGWMYVNEHGQMCGPYIQEQLYEGLSTGFLPDDLPVYPVLNGTLNNSIPLKYFRQFPDHVATGFAYLSVGISTSMHADSFTPCHGDLSAHRQDGFVKDAIPVSVFPGLDSIPNYQVNYESNLSNRPMLNPTAPHLISSYPLQVFLLFL